MLLHNLPCNVPISSDLCAFHCTGGADDRAARAGKADAGGARFAAAALQASRVPRGADRTDSGSEELMKKVAAAVEEAAPELTFLMVRPGSSRCLRASLVARRVTAAASWSPLGRGCLWITRPTALQFATHKDAVREAGVTARESAQFTAMPPSTAEAVIHHTPQQLVSSP